MRFIPAGVALAMLVAVACTGDDGGNGTPESPTASPNPSALPTPVPIELTGDDLYEEYRRGLITRHLASNGRLLDTVALESIDEAFHRADADRGESPFWRAFDGTIKIETSAGRSFNYPVANARYSVEYSADGSEIVGLWVPMLGAVKNHGDHTSGYYVVAGEGDNAGYYGGMALATFALEHLYDVDGDEDLSLEYARMLVDFFAKSELEVESGYIVRQGRWFNSRYNPAGEPLIRGASVEELLGIFLGLMYYLRAEDPNSQHWARARGLQQRILDAVAQGGTYSKYCHSSMSAVDDACYWVKHFEYAFNRSAGGTTGARDLYVSLMTQAAGNTNFGYNFENYLMYSIATILLLDGTLATHVKEDRAEEFMEHFVKAAYTAGPDVDKLQGNAFMGAMALLANKYLRDNASRDPFYEGPLLRKIWGSDMDVYRRLVGWADIAGRPTTFGPNLESWQHALPFISREDPSAGWTEHNPERRLGDWFVWKRPRGGHPNGAWQWNKSLPGQLNFAPGDWDVPYLGQSTSEAAFLASRDYVYQADDYEVDEACQGPRRLVGTADPPGHCDNQREGAGLGLIFTRMLLSHIAPTRYPPPRLDDPAKIPTLPFPGVGPFAPQLLDATARHWSKYDEPTFEVHGDNYQALDVASGDPDDIWKGVVFTATSTRKDKLRLNAWKIDVEDGRERVSLQASVNLGGFDRVVLAPTGGDSVLVALRAEEKRTSRPDLHWLRLDLYRLHGNQLSKRFSWQSDIREPKSVQSLEVAMLDSRRPHYREQYAVVMFKSKSDINRLMLFRIDYQGGSIEPVSLRWGTRDGSLNVQDGGSSEDSSVELTTIGMSLREDPNEPFDRIITAVEQPGRFWLSTRRHLKGFVDSSPVRTQAISGTLFDVAVVQSRYSPNPFVVAAAWTPTAGMFVRHLYLHAWELVGNSSGGELVYRGSQVGSIAGEHRDPREPQEVNYSRAEIVPFDLPVFGWSRRLGPGFIVIGRGPAVVTRSENGDQKINDSALKVLYARLMRDGRPTIESYNVAGGADLGSQLGGAGPVCTSTSCGVVTGHRTGNDHLSLIYWAYADPFEPTRWER